MSESTSVGNVLVGTVTRVEQYGILVEVEGVPGLIRIPELTWGRISHPSEFADIGDRVRFLVTNRNNPEEQPHEHFNGSIKVLSKSSP